MHNNRVPSKEHMELLWIQLKESGPSPHVLHHKKPLRPGSGISS
jgi:hypothetical protein